MNPKYNDTELIDRYLSQALGEDDRARFEYRLETDADFAYEVRAQKAANKIIIGKELLELKAQMQKDLGGSPGGFKYYLNYNVLIPVAVGLAVLTSAGYYYFKQQSMVVEGNKGKLVQKVAAEKPFKTNVNSVEDPKEQEKGFVRVQQAKVISDGKQDPTRDITETIEDFTNRKPDHSVDTAIITQSVAAKPADPVDAPAAVDPCDGFLPSGQVETVETCRNETNGRILIKPESIRGGKAPYMFSLNNHNSFKKKTEFTYLAKGTYSIYIKDGQGCTGLLNGDIQVKDKACKKAMDFTLTPAREGSWKIPVQENKEATLKIIGKSGDVVYEALVSAGLQEEWNGEDRNGNELPAGYYLFVLRYEGGETEQGSITIFR